MKFENVIEVAEWMEKNNLFDSYDLLIESLDSINVVDIYYEVNFHYEAVWTWKGKMKFLFKR